MAYRNDDLVRGYRWLGHTTGVTEIAVLHPKYRAGDRSWNTAHQAWPVTTYIRTADELVGIVEHYGGERMVCYGINPRPGPLYDVGGRVRAARSTDVITSQNIILDLDLVGSVSPSRLAGLVRFLHRADEYFTSIGLQRPVRASSGNRGSHLLFAYAPILVCDVPDMGERLRSFRERFVRAVRDDLSRVEARVDTGTLSLQAKIKVYGTGKPGGMKSRLYGTHRAQDPALRSYLLSLPARETHASARVIATPRDGLPDWFVSLLAADQHVALLYRGEGKAAGDISASGYDFSLIRLLKARGYRNADDLATILNLRPDGGVAHGRGADYVLRTINRALSG